MHFIELIHFPFHFFSFALLLLLLFFRLEVLCNVSAVGGPLKVYGKELERGTLCVPHQWNDEQKENDNDDDDKDGDDEKKK